METWHCKRCDTSVGEDELTCPVCDSPRYGARRRQGAVNVPTKQKLLSAETLNDLAKFAKEGKFTSAS